MRADRGRARRWARRLAIGAAVVAVPLVAAQLALDPLVTWRTRRVLDGLEGYRGRFADVEVSAVHLSYRIHDLRLEERSAGGAALPFFEVRRAEVGLHWKELLRGHVVGAIRFEGPKLSLVAAKPKGEGPEEAGAQLTKLAPVRLDRIEVEDGEVLFLDRTEEKGLGRLRVHGIEATVESFATRAALARGEPTALDRGEPTVLALRGTLQETGKLSVFASADPLARKLTFAGQAEVVGLQLQELAELLSAKAGVPPARGVLDLRARFVATDGALSGGVRPILKDASVRAAEPGLGAKLKALVADRSLRIFDDDAPGRHAVATTIPIRGSVDGAPIQAVPIILGIVRNAFVAGVTASLRELPPPTAKERQGALEQARRALSRDRGPPVAQPAPPGGTR